MSISNTPDLRAASIIQALDFEALETFLQSLARHLGNVRPHSRARAVQRLKTAINADLDLVLNEVAIGDDIAASVASASHELNLNPERT